MDVRDMAEVGGFLLAVGGIIYQAGKSRQWSDGIANLCRRVNAEQERRWLAQLADDVEMAETKEHRNRIARRIREEACRK
jgi:hypothetical protein